MFLRFVSREFSRNISSVIQPVKTVAVGVSVNNPIKNGCRCSFHKSFSTSACLLNQNDENNVTEKTKTRIPRRILKRVSKLGLSEEHVEYYTKVKVTQQNKSDISQAEDQHPYMHTPKDIDELLTGLKSAPVMEESVPEFPSDMKVQNWFRKQSRKAMRPKVDPQKTSIILFPGQGSQFVGMGEKLLAYDGVEQLYATASDILGYDLLQLCINGPKTVLDKTVHCQPAVMVTSIAAVEKMKEEHPEVHIFIHFGSEIKLIG